MRYEEALNFSHLTSRAPTFNVFAFLAQTGCRLIRATRETLAMASRPNSHPQSPAWRPGKRAAAPVYLDDSQHSSISGSVSKDVRIPRSIAHHNFEAARMILGGARPARHQRTREAEI